MDYLKPSFSSRPASQAYRDNYDAVFGKKEEKEEKKTCPFEYETGPCQMDMPHGHCKSCRSAVHGTGDVEECAWCKEGCGTPRREREPGP